MRAHAKSKYRQRTMGASSILAALIVLVSAVGQPAAAAPDRNLRAVRDQVRTLQARSEAATERYNDSRLRLEDVTRRLRAVERRAARERQELQRARSSIDAVARAAYVMGGVDTSLHVLLTESPGDFLAQAAALDQVARSQSSALRRSRVTRLRLTQTEAELADSQALATRYRNQMADAKAEADSRLDEAEGILAGLEADERRRLVAISEEERRQSVASATEATARLTARPGAPAANDRAASAVAFALSHVGDRYVAAAAGPSTWDCSGLTMAAWQHAGIALPHYSYSQLSATQRIPLSEARPGDLVFYFGEGVHHVGLYIGGGKMVHAANPSDGVLVTDILGPWYEKYFSGIGRVVA
ncbi:MAG: hypothetical protein GC156_14755 [Actinomycetales bacterium]|nr:hypothetical protein [Actinomycetales bacterium]